MQVGLNSIYLETIEKQYKHLCTNLACRYIWKLTIGFGKSWQLTEVDNFESVIVNNT